MGYTLDQFAADCKAALQADSGIGGMEKCRDFVSKACKDQAFVKEFLPENPDKERRVIYEDPDLGFCICAHVYNDAKQGSPHDHGPTWAIYGQAMGETWLQMLLRNHCAPELTHTESLWAAQSVSW